MQKVSKWHILLVASLSFDAVGGTGNYLVLGLQTQPDRDLDAYSIVDGKLVFTGFQEHFSPKVKKLITYLRKNGVRVSQVKRPKQGLKTLAVKAGVGYWGKNSLVLHPTFGPWLRLVVLQTDIDFGWCESDVRHRRFQGCADCTKCVDACPRKLIAPYLVTDRTQCLANLEAEHVPIRRCDRCITICPYGS